MQTKLCIVPISRARVPRNVPGRHNVCVRTILPPCSFDATMPSGTPASRYPFIQLGEFVEDAAAFFFADFMQFKLPIWFAPSTMGG